MQGSVCIGTAVKVDRKNYDGNFIMFSTFNGLTDVTVQLAFRVRWEVKCAILHEECRRGAHRKWIDHWSMWRMASATPDLRLPSQPQGIAARWPVPNYTAWWQRHMRVKNLPKLLPESGTAVTRTRDLLSHKSDALTIYTTSTDLYHDNHRVLHSVSWFSDKILNQSIN